MRQDEFIKRVLPLTDKIFRLVLGITGNKEDAEDIVQDTMLNIWKKEIVWEEIDNIEGYCFRTARNLALNKIALKENQAERIPEKFDIEEVDDKEEKEEDEEKVIKIREIVKTLPEKQRTIFELRDIEEMSYKEVAKIMDISEEQVKINLFRARQKIKDFFKKNDNRRD